MTRGILVYTPDPGEARAYADLIRLPSRGFTVHVAETRAAVKIYNDLAEGALVAGLFHSAC